MGMAHILLEIYVNLKYWLYPVNESTHNRISIKWDLGFCEKPLKIPTNSCKEKLYKYWIFQITKEWKVTITKVLRV